MYKIFLTKPFLISLALVVFVSLAGVAFANSGSDPDALTRKQAQLIANHKTDLHRQLLELTPQIAKYHSLQAAEASDDTELGKLGYSFGDKGLEKAKPFKFVLGTDVKPAYDLDKLAHAVAFAETGHCKDGTAVKRNNCHGIMTWDKNGRHPAYFKTQADSFKAFKKIWSTSYKRYPDLALATKWTGGDQSRNWLNNVNVYYNSHSL